METTKMAQNADFEVGMCWLNLADGLINVHTFGTPDRRRTSAIEWLGWACDSLRKVNTSPAKEALIRARALLVQLQEEGR